MSRAAVELDFFGMEKSKSKSQSQRILQRRRSFQNIQSAISKINPEILKSVIGSGSVNLVSKGKSPANGHFVPSRNSFSVPSTPRPDQNLIPASPLVRPMFRHASESFSETAPLTIFYNGTVSVFNVSEDKAENIMKLAAKAINRTGESIDYIPIASCLRDLPFARRKSLQRFLEGRKDRMVSVSPYAWPYHKADEKA